MSSLMASITPDTAMIKSGIAWKLFMHGFPPLSSNMIITMMMKEKISVDEKDNIFHIGCTIQWGGLDFKFHHSMGESGERRRKKINPWNEARNKKDKLTPLMIAAKA